jgi:hypothetical protein
MRLMIWGDVPVWAWKMTLLLVGLLAVLHALLIARFGTKGNEPFLIFAAVDAALALAVYFAVPYVLWVPWRFPSLASSA